MDGSAEEVVLGRAGEATLTLGTPVRDPDIPGTVRVPALLTTGQLTARQDLELESWGGGLQRLVDFLDDLANAWRGWSGAKEWSDDHGSASFGATHDGLGTVSLEVRFESAPGWDGPGSTKVRVAVPVDPGSFGSAARFLQGSLGDQT